MIFVKNFVFCVLKERLNTKISKILTKDTKKLEFLSGFIYRYSESHAEIISVSVMQHLASNNTL